MSTDIDLFSAHRGFPMDHLSPSFISKYEQCPLAALYYREGKPKQWDPRYAEQGRWTHSVLEKKYAPDAKIYTPSCGIDREMENRHVMSMRGYATLLREDNRFDPGRMHMHHPEVHVSVTVAGVPVMGIIDLLTVRGSIVYIDDWKTGLYKAADEQQIRIYTMMISRIMSIPPRDIVATLDYLREEPKKIQRRVPYTSTAAIEGHIIRDIIEPINDLQFIPNVGRDCARCEYRHLCEAW